MARRDCVPPRLPVAMGSYHESPDRRQFARIFGSISQPLMPGMLMFARIRLSKASAMTLRRYVDLKILHYRFGPEDHPHPIRNQGQGFLENHRDFCCLNLEKVLSLLYTLLRIACRLIFG